MLKGLAALHNYQVIIRQTFYHGCYALIGEDLYPNPDFWLSALYKTLVSDKVSAVHSVEICQFFYRMILREISISL